ncbi:hypothetical protein SLS62_010605 [Diatrype stigma]|uniref:Cytochrome P450 n=1 Tax=Diatrype stigma TaxID=117547 RepID=A0AAN9U8W3_9PEZI
MVSTKSPLYAAAQMTPQHSILDTLDAAAHRRKRKVVSQPISERAMRAFEPTMSEQIDAFIQQLAASAVEHEPVNMTERCLWLAGDVAGHLAFGYPLRLQTEPTNRWLQRGLASANARLNTYMQWPALHGLEPVLKAVARKTRGRYVDIVARMIRARLALDRDAKQDLYSSATAAAAADGKGADGGGGDGGGQSPVLAQSEIWAEAFVFIVAGGNTIASTMSAMFFYLSRNPGCYRRLAEEIRSGFGSAEEIRAGEQLRRCRYLRACVKEALRVSPPNTATLWRRQSADDSEPLVIDGHAIPPGTDIGVNLYSLHHNADYFPDPFVYRPERWLEEAEETTTNQRAWAPFIAGTHSCPGQAVTWLETSLTFARTLWHFDFEAAPGKLGQTGAGEPGRTDGRGRAEEFQMYDTFSAMHDGPVLVFRRR